MADEFGGWTCCVEQGRYGHYARKPTLLLVYGVAREDLPELEWGIGERQLDPAVVERMGLKRAIRLGEVGGRGGGTDSSYRIGTPEPFRDLLLSIARTARPSTEPGRQDPSPCSASDSRLASVHGREAATQFSDPEPLGAFDDVTFHGSLNTREERHNHVR